MIVHHVVAPNSELVTDAMRAIASKMAATVTVFIFILNINKIVVVLHIEKAISNFAFQLPLVVSDPRMHTRCFRPPYAYSLFPTPFAYST